MRTTIHTLLTVVLTAGLSPAQQPSQTGFWQGKLESYSFDFFYGVGIEDSTVISREGWVERHEYDLYQSPAGVAREELTNLTRTRTMTIVGSPYNIRIFDYTRGKGVAFFKDRQEGAEGPLIPLLEVSPRQPRTILGFACEGKHYRWATFQNATVELDTWTAQGGGPRVPLLEVSYVTDPRGSLLGLTVTMVTKLEPAADLPASLFEVPERVRPTHVESVWGR
jgi:hypothetical protein